MHKRETYCLNTWNPKPLPADLTPAQLRWKWAWWKALLEKTNERGSRCSPYELGRRMALERGWTLTEFYAADYIIRNESSWDPCAHYPSVHGDCGYGPFPYGGGAACGIPQALPCDKLIGKSRELGDMSVRAQIAWAYNYMDGRYGGPIQAKAHKVAYGWF